MADGSSALLLERRTNGVASAQQLNTHEIERKNLYPNEYCPPEALHKAWRGKRILDIAGALGLALALSPIILTVTLVLLFSEGPILFKHQRIGRHGKRFGCYKFRSMVPNAQEKLETLLKDQPELRTQWLHDHKLKDDPRITRVGGFLRRTSLDELPQLLNVLRGEMSLVGPRPIVADEIFRYGRAFRHYVAVKPGLTGLWQVAGRNDVTYRRRVAMDRLYTMYSCVWLDMRILAKTITAVLQRQGAY